MSLLSGDARQGSKGREARNGPKYTTPLTQRRDSVGMDAGKSSKRILAERGGLFYR